MGEDKGIAELRQMVRMFSNFNSSIWHALWILVPLGSIVYSLSFFSLKSEWYFFDPKHNTDPRLKAEGGELFDRDNNLRSSGSPSAMRLLYCRLRPAVLEVCDFRYQVTQKTRVPRGVSSKVNSKIVLFYYA